MSKWTLRLFVYSYEKSNNSDLKYNNKIMDYVKPKDASKYYNVSENTLRSWSSQGKIKYITTQGGHRRYHIDNTQKQPNQNYLFKSLF